MSIKCILPPVPICGSARKTRRLDDRPFPEEDYKVFPRENLYDRIILPGKINNFAQTPPYSEGEGPGDFRKLKSDKPQPQPQKPSRRLPDIVSATQVTTDREQNCDKQRLGAQRLNSNVTDDLKEVKKPAATFLSVSSDESRTITNSNTVISPTKDPAPARKSDQRIESRQSAVRERGAEPGLRNLEPCDINIILQTIALNGLDKDRPPPLPPRRLSFPQVRTLTISFSPSPHLTMTAGQQVLVTGISHRPSRFLVQLEGFIFHVPYNYFI